MNTTVPFLVYVSDNGSSDQSVDTTRRYFPQVRLIENRENLGFARANNLILKSLNTDYALLLNPDTLLTPDTVPKMTDFMDSHPEAGAIGPKLIRPNGEYDVTSKFGDITVANLLMKKLGLARIFRGSEGFGEFNLTYLGENQIMKVNAVTGASMMVRKQAIIQAGLMDESYFLGCEDVDWCLRIKSCSTEDGSPYEVYYYPEAVVTHLGRQTRTIFPEISIREFHRSSWLFYQKYEAMKHSRLTNYLVKFGLLAAQELSLMSQINLRPFRKRKH